MTTQELIQQALNEDMPNGDLTTESLNIENHFGTAYLTAKQDLVLSGTELFSNTLTTVDAKLETHWKFQDGDGVLNKQVIAHLQGNLINLLKAERVALNFLGHLSGVATLTNQFVKACGDYDCKILDTRKTTPLYRELEKKAVLDGGGHNHRLNLSDGVMIKENHLAIGEGIALAVEKIRHKIAAPITLEVKNFHECEQAVEARVERVMFDNMSNEEMKRCLEIIPENMTTEASGNMTLERISAVAALGIDTISIGALTHSAPIADISLIFNW